MKHISRTYVETEGLGRRLCKGGGSQELVGGGLTSARRTAPNGQAGMQDRHPRHRLASMAGKSPRSNWTSAWGLQAVRAWQVVHVWQTCRSTRKMGRIVPRWCSILSYRHCVRTISRLQFAFVASPPHVPRAGLFNFIDTGFARCYSLPTESPVRSRIRPCLEVTVWKTLFRNSSS
jgi:hypothetical protein